MAANILGFPVSSSTGGGEFTPIVKYDARAGRIFRVDRVDTGDGFANELTDITATFKAVFDFETVLAGWMLFLPNTAPSFAVVHLNPDNQTPLPPQPSPEHKHGTKTMIKLNKACGGDKPVREIAGNSDAWKRAYEKLYTQYRAEKHKYPGQLPVVVLASADPVTASNGKQKSTNYQPNWRIDGWVPRPQDLPAEIRQPSMAISQTLPAPMTADDFDTPKPPPATGNQTVPPPNRYQAPAAIAPQANTIVDDDSG